MLQQLHIKNFTLIDELNIELHPGFSVITGETGAGKSIILGAIGLLLGQRADTKAIKRGADKCIIEAHFDLTRYQMKNIFDENEIEYDPADTIIRRELTASGKSRAFINDTPVSLSLLKELGEQLVDVHSQHQNLLLSKQDFQLNVVDIIAHSQQLLADYQQCYEQYRNKQQELKQQEEEIERNRQQTDFLQFQYDELSAANLNIGEQEELEQQSETMTHAEDIKSALYVADNELSGETGAVVLVKKALNALSGINAMLPKAQELAERLDSCHIELKDLAQEVGSALEDCEFEPADLEAVNQRLDRIYELQKKYHVDSVEQLIGIRNELQQKLNHIENSEETLDELRQEIATLETACRERAARLSELRTKAAQDIEQQMLQRLVPLGMPHVRFQISVARQPLGRQGQDSISFLFSANTSTPLQPVAQVASGGEIARVMLSLKAMISGAVKLPTIIFDEIDTGVSGKIAEKMAEIMQEMGRHERQVISITHLPQIAAKGSWHYRVSKEETANGTASHMKQLNADERIREIAQMLSGSDISEAAIQNAKELLNK